MTAASAVDQSLLRSRPFQRLLGASALAHLVFAGVLTFQNWRPLPDLDEAHVVYIEELPAAALPAPSPAKPAPARQQVKEIVIPNRPKPKPRPPQAKPVPAKPDPKPVESKPVAEPEPEAKPTQNASSLLDKLREEAKNRQPRGVPEGSPEGKGEIAGILDAEKAAYVKKVQAAIEPHWLSTACQRRAAPRWVVEVASSGATSGLSLGRTSGDRYCDDSAERAILKAQLPAPPRGVPVVLGINFEELR